MSLASVQLEMFLVTLLALVVQARSSSVVTVELLKLNQG